MKRTQICTLLTALGLYLLISGSASAQQGTEGDPKRADAVREGGPGESEPPEAKADAGQREPDQPSAEARRSNTRAQRYIAEIVKLQDTMKKKLSLSKKQEEVIDALFRDYVRAVKERQEARRQASARPEAADELRQLRDKMLEARDSGDMEAVRQLREQFRQKLRLRSGPPGADAGQFVQKVAAELDEKQRPAFRKLARRLSTGNAHRPPQLNREIYYLWRAVLQPDVGASSEQKKEIQGMVRKAHLSIEEAESDEVKVKEITAKVRSDILEKLTPEQRAKVEAAMKEPFGRDRRPGMTPEGKEDDAEEASSGKDVQEKKEGERDDTEPD